MRQDFDWTKPAGLYDPANEHDNCGVGFVANIDGKKEHAIIEKGLQVLENLVHRGAVGGDLVTGDGAGILFQLPDAFFRGVAGDAKIKLPEAGAYGVGMLFLSPDKEKGEKGIQCLREAAREVHADWLGLREVPTNPDCLGRIALAGMPRVVQCFVAAGGLTGDALERKLYVLRKTAENKARELGMHHADFYACSFSSRTIVYKGLFVADQIKRFFPDISDERMVSALALVHQRYSTNTFPTWSLAQPFRFLAHNGEINTLRGNMNKMRAREGAMTSDLFGSDIKRLLPVCDPEGSDSAVFDNTFELLVNGGRSLEHSMMMMVPEAFGAKYHISADKRAFYEYHCTFMEPWDGPAALVFSDGVRIGATLDRNGLRPARWTLTTDGFLVLASEAGVLDIPVERILRKGRLQPGRMFLVDTAQGRMRDDVELKAAVSRGKQYRHWLDKNHIELKGLFALHAPARPDRETLLKRQITFGYTWEHLEKVLHPMAVDGQEPVTSMGIDAALAVLSEQPQLLYNYFKQLFAQVTNPPIDPIREGLVMSLMSYIGRDGNLLTETPRHARKLKLPHPVLTNDDLERIKTSTHEHLVTAVVPSLFPVDGPEGAMEKAFDDLCERASRAVADGASVVLVTDRGTDEKHAPIPALLAVAGLHQYLIKTGQRAQCGIVLESGEPREVQHFALLLAYGVDAVNPYLALETIQQMKEDGALGMIDDDDAVDNFITSVKKGLLKVFSKMGISTLRSYKGAQIFEAIGLGPALVDKFFTFTPSRIGGIGTAEVEREARARHRLAWAPNRRASLLEVGGHHRVRVKAENHLWTPLTIKTLQAAVRNDDFASFKQFSKQLDEQAGRLCTLRGLFKFKAGTPVPLAEVEPEAAIFKRFATGAMSFGSISREAHETLAIAMNRLGGRSNTGEGGEEPERFLPRPDGTTARSSIKQVASGRFGVTTEYLVNADELQIKMAQGAKPGEGGQLPGHKVDATIGKVRHSTPGVTLISPPPHHDIYSIEDLAQLIFDLRNVNPAARISVKLVAEVGVGTVAAGVAKAKADLVVISGHDGGTGASPASSILYAGGPWELGVAETQQTLVNNHLRDKITVQTDGKLNTGRDVVVAALLGAEEFGFATGALIAQGCLMMRKCHLNTCPVGIATQDPALRAKFTGKPEHVERFMRFIAREVRELMAELGFRTMDEMIGRVDRLDVNEAVQHWKTKGLDLSALLYAEHLATEKVLRRTVGQTHDWSLSLDPALIEKCTTALEKKTPVKLAQAIKNCNRTVGTTLSGEVAKRYGDAGLPEATIQVDFTGAAGQSFGAFLARGIAFRLEGEANDYLGKGLSGGRIAVVPPAGATFRPEDNIIVGNTLLYGATSGEVFIRGMAGERFAVRNSGASAVVEGVGDHGCEYMTGGTVVVLGRTGRNFAAGMSGGSAYVLDDNQLFDTLCNLEMVDVEPVTDPEDAALLRGLVTRHVEHTGSALGQRILDEWAAMLPRFVKVMPMDYKKALAEQHRFKRRESEAETVTEEVR